MANPQTSTHYFNEFQKNATAFSGQSAWLRQLRQHAIENFKLIGFPVGKNEHWKYADLSSFETPFFISAFAENNNSFSVPSLKESYQIVFIDGIFAAHLSQLPVSENFCIYPLSQAWQLRESQVREYLEGYVEAHGFACLNTSFLSEGVFIELKNRLNKPLHILYISTQTHSLQTIRNLIILKSHSEATLLEEHMGFDAAFKNQVTQVFLAENSQLNYYKIQNEALENRHLSQLVVKQKQNSRFNHFSLAFGSLFAREDIQVDLIEKGAEVSLQGLYIGGDKQYIDHHTRIDHYVESCNSQENYRGILTDQSVGVFNGKVVVHPKAQKTQAKQSNQNLLLSKQAEINTKPELEIYADDVKCAHGATVGELDHDALFYLRSRGIDEMNAKILLTQAFAQEIVETVTILSIKEYLQDQMMKRLTDLFKSQSLEVNR